MAIDEYTGLGVQTIADMGIVWLLGGGPLEGYMPVFRERSLSLGIDANLVLAWYLYNHRREADGSPGGYEWMQWSPADFNNPFDFTCTTLSELFCVWSSSAYAKRGCTVAEDRSGNRQCFAMYTSIVDNIFAAYWLVDVIRKQGARNYGEVLRMMCCNRYSDCGHQSSGCDEDWVQAIVAQADLNATQVPRNTPCKTTCCAEMTGCIPCDPDWHCFQSCDPSCCKQSSTCLACSDAPDCPVPPATVVPPPKDTNKPGSQPGPLVPPAGVPWLVVGAAALGLALIGLLPSRERAA